MQIHRSSRLIRYAYLFSDDVPQRTNLCKLFWRTVLVTCVFSIPVAASVGYVCAWIYKTKDTLAATMIVLFAIGIGVGGNYVETRAKRRRAAREGLPPVPPVPPSLPRLYVQAVKSRVCPFIDIVRE